MQAVCGKQIDITLRNTATPNMQPLFRSTSMLRQTSVPYRLGIRAFTECQAVQKSIVDGGMLHACFFRLQFLLKNLLPHRKRAVIPC